MEEVFTMLKMVTSVFVGGKLRTPITLKQATARSMWPLGN